MASRLPIQITDSDVERLLATVKYIPFFNSTEDDYSHLNISREEYFAVLYEMQRRIGTKTDPIEKQLQILRFDMNHLYMLAQCVSFGRDEEIYNTLKGKGFNVDLEPQELIDSIIAAISKIKTKYDLVDGQRPKIKAAEKVTGHDVLASLSSALEFRIPDDICISEYIAHSKAAKAKAKAAKKSVKKK